MKIALKTAMRYRTVTTNSKAHTTKSAKDVFMIRLDWSTTDADGIDTELYEDYDEAYDRYKEIITEQLKNFWQGEVTFDTDGDPGEEYEFSKEDEVLT